MLGNRYSYGELENRLINMVIMRIMTKTLFLHFIGGNIYINRFSRKICFEPYLGNIPVFIFPRLYYTFLGDAPAPNDWATLFCFCQF